MIFKAEHKSLWLEVDLERTCAQCPWASYIRASVAAALRLQSLFEPMQKSDTEPMSRIGGWGGQPQRWRVPHPLSSSCLSSRLGKQSLFVVIAEDALRRGSPLKHWGPGCLGGSAVECLPLAQGVIPGSWNQVSHRAPRRESASPSACVSASLWVSHE